MPVEVKKRGEESSSYLISRFIRKIQQSGVLREIKRRRFHSRTVNRNGRRVRALNRETKKREFLKAKKLGLL